MATIAAAARAMQMPTDATDERDCRSDGAATGQAPVSALWVQIRIQFQNSGILTSRGFTAVAVCAKCTDEGEGMTFVVCYTRGALGPLSIT